VDGRIIDERRGVNGFGYDPIFFIPELEKTAAELPPEVKNKVSHRGQAFARLKKALKNK
jgi:XTP/dITP diphosphohydrolase